MMGMLGYKIHFDGPGFQNLRGPSEKDIVYSGLEELMVSAVQSNWKRAVEQKTSLRIACYVKSLERIYECEQNSGIAI
jgi:glutamate dehydrogenase/leucine dehydrogenase